MMASAAGAALAEVVSTAGSGLVATGATVAVGLAYRVVRPFFKAAVNCHFCNTDCKVKYNDRNSWYCPYCGQYNGFTVDGDYNQRDHLFTSTPVHMYTEPRKPSKEPANNGLCRKCNLNQELKLNQLSSFSSDDNEFEEYKAHLERVYRLCAVCEAVLAERLGEQNAIITPGLLEHRLETSRIASTKQNLNSGQSLLRKILWHLQIVVAVTFFLTLLKPNLPTEYLDILPFSCQMLLEHVRILGMKYEVEIFICQTGLLALLGLALGPGNPVYILNLVPFILENIGGVPNWWRLATALILFTLVPLVSLYKKTKSGTGSGFIMARILPDSLSAKLIALDSCEDLDETLTSRDSITTKSSSEGNGKQCNNDGGSPFSTIGLFTKLTGFVNATTTNLGKNGTTPRRVHSPLIWSGDQGTLNHEFVVQSGRDCDLASLTLGEEGLGGYGSASPPVFSQRVYSPTPNPDGIKFTPSRPILRPAQLTSWVAGGYWSPPDNKVLGETHSRSSSQSSGFVSTGLVSGSPSLNNLSSLLPANLSGLLSANLSNQLPTNHVSLPTSPHNSILEDFDRNSVLSAPMMKRDYANQSFVTQRRHTTEEQLSESSMGRVSQIELSKLIPTAQSSPNCSPSATPTPGGGFNSQSKSLYEKLSFTVTVTPVGFILAASLTINFALMYFYMAK
jgi:hypothetical protein